MVRDFSGKKREELYRALDGIDDREWKPFMAWCGGKENDFGEWVERLDISFYTRQIDNYQNEVLRTNNSTREQIDIIFENVAETDRRYAETFREYAEAVKEQMAWVSVMTEVMQEAGEPGADIKVILCNVENQRNTKLEYAERCLDSCLEERGYSNSIEREFIVDMIRKKRPDLLEELYSIKSYNVSFWEIPMKKIEAYYNKHKMDITIENVKNLDFGEGMDQTQKETFVACWNQLGQMELSKEHIIAVMANIYAESRFSATNAQESFGYKGIYDNYEFKTDDSVGYGICQWTVESRKEGLLEFANNTNGSVHDLETQLDYFRYEMENELKVAWNIFLSRDSTDEAVKIFWSKIEIAGASLHGEGTSEYQKGLEERINYADIITDWYNTTFNQEEGT